MRKILPSIILFVSLALQANAQSVIRGRVVNALQEPIPFATVILKTPADSALVAGATTNNEGNFILENITMGTFQLHVQFVGFQTFRQEIVYSGNLIDLNAIELKEDATLLKEVMVRSQRQLIEQDGEKLRLNVANTITASGGSAWEVLSRAPGLSIDQNDQISLNGKSGTTIMIDGKITYLPAAELSAMLRSMNASNIEAIEVIANPTARYDAAGNAGIINIQMKKNMWEGVNGSVQAGAGYGRYGKAVGGLNLNYRNQKWSHFVNYNFNRNRNFSTIGQQRNAMTDNGRVYFETHTDRIPELQAHSWQAGTEYQVNQSNTLALSTSGGINTRNTYVNTTTGIGALATNPTDSIFSVTNHQKYRWTNTIASLGFKHVFEKPGHEFTFDLDYSNYHFQLNDELHIINADNNLTPKENYEVLSDQPTSFTIRATRLDYVRPLNSKTNVEAGVKVSRVTTDSDVVYQNSRAGEFMMDTELSNDFNYTENIAAAYINIKSVFAGFNIQAGLRAEHTDYLGVSARADKSIARSYWKFFPSANLSRKYSDNYRIGFSYSYRIDRPAYNDLYPFTFYQDPFSSQRGNPQLLPQFTHSIQLSQTIATDYTVSIGYSNTSQYMAFLILLNDDNVSGYATRANFNHHYNYNLSLVAPVRITHKWSTTINASAFYNRFSTQFLNDVHSQEAFSGTVNISQVFTLRGSMSAELATTYFAPNVSGLFQNEALGSVNLGVQKPLFNKKGMLRVNASDLFMTNRIRNRLQYPGLDFKFTSRFESRVVRINFTYTFGKNTTKAGRKRNAQEDEQRRINTN